MMFKVAIVSLFFVKQIYVNMLYGGEVGPSFSMPKFDPASFSSGTSPEGRLDWRVKIRFGLLATGRSGEAGGFKTSD